MDHYWRDLPGPIWFSGADLYRRFVAGADGPRVAVELGAWKGRSTCCMAVEIANSGKPIRFFAVDHWQGSAGEAAHDTDPDLAGGRLFDVFSHNIAPVADHVTPIRGDSAEAAAGFADETVDFLYIDASHDFAGVLRDLEAWWPKVKVGGTIAGDDWCFASAGEYGVRNAVRLFLGAAAGAVRVEPGSAPNSDWLQWSLVKTAAMRPAGSRRRRLHRALQLVGRTLRPRR